MTNSRGAGLRSSTPSLIDAEVPLDLLAAERLDRHDRAVLDELGRGRGLDLALHAERAEELHGALAHERRARMDRGSRMALDDQGRDALGTQEHRHREADEASSDDHDRDIVVRHVDHLPRVCLCARVCAGTTA